MLKNYKKIVLPINLLTINFIQHSNDTDKVIDHEEILKLWFYLSQLLNVFSWCWFADFPSDALQYLLPAGKLPVSYNSPVSLKRIKSLWILLCSSCLQFGYSEKYFRTAKRQLTCPWTQTLTRIQNMYIFPISKIPKILFF